MNVIPLTCAQCDAPIRVNEVQTSVICEHCETQLLIDVRPDGVRAEIVDEILRRTESLAQELKALRAERKLKNLDRRWHRRRRRFREREQKPQGDPLAGVVIFGMLGGIGALLSRMWLLGIMALVLTGAIAFVVVRQRALDEKTRKAYRRRRRKLVFQMREKAGALS